jgi:hypothetical protein
VAIMNQSSAGTGLGMVKATRGYKIALSLDEIRELNNMNR